MTNLARGDEAKNGYLKKLTCGEQEPYNTLVGVLLACGPHVTGPCLVTPPAQLSPPVGGVASQPALECLEVQQPIDGGVG